MEKSRSEILRDLERVSQDFQLNKKEFPCNIYNTGLLLKALSLKLKSRFGLLSQTLHSPSSTTDDIMQCPIILNQTIKWLKNVTGACFLIVNVCHYFTDHD